MENLKDLKGDVILKKEGRNLMKATMAKRISQAISIG